MIPRSVLLDWHNSGISSEELDILSPEEARELSADIMASDKEWFFEAISEGFMKQPTLIPKVIEHLRRGENSEAGEIFLDILAWYPFNPPDEVVQQLKTVEEQEGFYRGDE